jgi:chromosome segregation ATPase
MDETTAILIGLTVLGIVLLLVMMVLLYPRISSDTKEREAIRQDWQEINDRLSSAESRWRGEVERSRRERIQSEERLTKILETEREKVIDLEYRLSRLIDQNRGLQNELTKMAMENGHYQKQINELQSEKTQLTDRVKKLERILKERGFDTGPLDQGTKK